MNELSFKEIIERSVQIREAYHELERELHGKEWNIEEDALAFLTDAGLVGRLTMSHEGRWPVGGDAKSELEHKLAECIWWLIIMAKRMDVDISVALKTFLFENIKF